MARIAGVDIPRAKRLVISLTYIYGIGPSVSKKICAAVDIDAGDTCHVRGCLPFSSISPGAACAGGWCR